MANQIEPDNHKASYFPWCLQNHRNSGLGSVFNISRRKGKYKRETVITSLPLADIAQDFLKVMEKCPNRLKRKINTVTNLKARESI